MGAHLGQMDNQTTGRLIKVDFALETTIVPPDGDWAEAARTALSRNPAALVVQAPARDLLALADLPEARDRLIFNTGSADDELRGAQCRRNILHTLPGRAMLADALAQFAARKRWSRILLLTGERPEDGLFAAALRASSRKFGLRVVAEKALGGGADLRRTAQAEMPLLTQAPEYDMVFVADEARDFGPFVPYNTFLPRPVGGSAGLEPQAWNPVIEQWGALQLQSRFRKRADRAMGARDWAAWAAVRSVGEAVTRTRSTDRATLAAYIRSATFELAGFKGRPLSFRPWDGQMRQPIHLVYPGALVAVAPLEGFLHKVTELDTLGADAPETACRFKE